MGRSFVRCALFGALVLATATAAAQVRIGVTVSATGPAASLGIPERNTIPMRPKTAGGKSIEYIVLDDSSDTTTAVQNTRKLMGESKVDALIGSTTTPNSLGMIDVFADGRRRRSRSPRRCASSSRSTRGRRGRSRRRRPT